MGDIRLVWGNGAQPINTLWLEYIEDYFGYIVLNFISCKNVVMFEYESGELQSH